MELLLWKTIFYVYWGIYALACGHLLVEYGSGSGKVVPPVAILFYSLFTILAFISTTKIF